MADIANAAVSALPPASPTGAVDPFVAGTTYEILGVRTALTPPAQYLQKIYDTSAGWVYYTRTTTDPSSDPPLTTDTQPNHTNNLQLATHAILKEV